MHARVRSLALLAMFGAMPLAAQGKIGLVVGAVSSSLKYVDVDDSEGLKSLMGFAVGISLPSKGSGSVTFNPEVLYVMKGDKYVASTYTEKTKLSYLEVPLLARIAVGHSKAAPFITVGPSVAYNLSCKFDDGDTNEDCAEDFDEDSGVNKIDFGAMVGVGAHFGKVSVSARYDMGLTNINKGDGGLKIKNKALMLLAGIRF